MARPEWMVDNIPALKLLDMSGANEDLLMAYVGDKFQNYIYDPNDGTAGNDEWIVEPDPGRGDGAWFPVSEIYGTTTPTGFTAHPIVYHRVTTSSQGNFVNRIYSNPGNSSNWNFVNLT